MSDEVIILIHGTYANDEADDGQLWWQRGSGFWNRLRKKLPAHIDLPETGSLFHWSGENDALERHIAASALYNYLLELERRAIPYHVIAHSHGGSVLWSALRLAELGPNRNRRHSLTGLRSCTTVGTPFLIYDQPKHPMTTLWLLEGVALILQIGLPIGAAVLLWPYYGFWAIFALVLVVFTMPLVEVRTFPLKFAGMQTYDSSIARKYGDRWLSISSPDDEAINALRGALRLKDTKVSFKPSQPIVPAQASNLLVNILFLGHTIALFLFDKFMVPWLSRVVRNQIAVSTLGVRATSRIREIVPWPCDGLRNQPPLPKDVQNKLKSDADKHLSKTAPAVRETLRSLSSGEVNNPLRFMQDNALRELVHTSYLENEEVVSIVVSHIMSHSSMIDHAAKVSYGDDTTRSS